MAGYTHSFLLAILALLFVSVSGDTCRTVENAYKSIEVARRGSNSYYTSQNDYWNKALAKTKPSCVIFPQNARDTQRVVDVLGANTEQFAIKAGGLMPNADFSSTSAGPVISLVKMKDLDYNPYSQTIRVGPGVLWQDIVSYLTPYKRTVVGARLGNVGVSGMLLGGGLSFLSPQYGWASTQVADYEIVLANGTLVNATDTVNSQLRRAIQTGGNAFGIVTAFTLKTVPQTDVWGGVRTYEGDKTALLLMALRDFTEYNTDPKASIVAAAEMKLFGRETEWVVFYFYDGPSPPQGVFNNFNRIQHAEDKTRRQKYREMLRANNEYYRNNTFTSMSTETLPLPPRQNADEVLTTLHNYWARATKDFVRKATGSSGIIVYQPVPKSVSRASASQGGNFGMDMMSSAGAHDGLIVEYDYSYLFNNAQNAVSLEETTRRMFTGAQDLISQFVRKGSLPTLYRPLFMNSASEKQDFWARSNGREFAKSIKSQVDPLGMFGKRSRGWVL